MCKRLYHPNQENYSTGIRFAQELLLPIFNEYAIINDVSILGDIRLIP